jgi:hypothetical protein
MRAPHEYEVNSTKSRSLISFEFYFRQEGQVVKWVFF